MIRVVGGLSKRVPDANWSEMIACVNTTARPAVAVRHGHLRRRPGDVPLRVALLLREHARFSGLGHDFYADNNRAIDAVVARVP